MRQRVVLTVRALRPVQDRDMGVQLRVAVAGGVLHKHGRGQARRVAPLALPAAVVARPD